MRLRLATRGSKLAWGQSEIVADALRAHGHQVELVKITTFGDVTTAPLASLGGTGVFVGAVRAAVLSGDCDFAVHSFKDLPTAPTDGLLLAAVPPREDPADALCSADGRKLADLPTGARVGTGSPRRAAQLLSARPDLVTVEIRGNVETRLARAGADLDAVLLAAAGLARLGLTDRICDRFDPEAFLPAPSQGALAIECRGDAPEVLAALGVLDDPPTRLAAAAERAVLAGLQAGCAAPVGAHALLAEDRLQLTATVIAVDGTRRITERAEVDKPDQRAAETLGGLVAKRLLAAGAAELVRLSAAKPSPLTGRRLLLPSRCPAELIEALTQAGAHLTQAEFTRQEPLPVAELEAAIRDGYDWLVISSAATLNSLAAEGFSLADHHRSGARIATVGPATAQAIRAAGLEPDLVAYPGSGAALVTAFEEGPGTVLMPGAVVASVEPAAGLTSKGWTVRSVPVYQTVGVEVPEQVIAAWSAHDALIATAGSMVRCVAALGLPALKVIAIGEPSAEAAASAGMEVIGVATTPDAPGLLEAVLTALA